MGQSNYHERAEELHRPEDERDPFSFESMCRVARQSDRLQTLLAKHRLLAASIEKAEAAREEADDDTG